MADGRPDNDTGTPGGGSLKDRVNHWIGLFRNQILLQTIGTICAGFFMFAGLGGWSNLNLFVIGMLAGLPFSVIVELWYWRIFDEVLHDGPVVLWTRYDKTSGPLVIATHRLLDGISRSPTPTDDIRDRDSFREGGSYETYMVMHFVRDWEGFGSQGCIGYA